MRQQQNPLAPDPVSRIVVHSWPSVFFRPVLFFFFSVYLFVCLSFTLETHGNLCSPSLLVSSSCALSVSLSLSFLQCANACKRMDTAVISIRLESLFVYIFSFSSKFHHVPFFFALWKTVFLCPKNV